MRFAKCLLLDFSSVLFPQMIESFCLMNLEEFQIECLLYARVQRMRNLRQCWMGVTSNSQINQKNGINDWAQCTSNGHRKMLQFIVVLKNEILIQQQKKATTKRNKMSAWNSTKPKHFIEVSQ